jgi:hypothetical protein
MRRGFRYAAYAVNDRLEGTGSRALKAWPLPVGFSTSQKVLDEATAWTAGYVERHPFIGVEIYWEEYDGGERCAADLEHRAFGREAAARIDAAQRAEVEVDTTSHLRTCDTCHGEYSETEGSETTCGLCLAPADRKRRMAEATR